VKVFLRTYGCRANHYDSEQIKALLDANGAVLVESEEDADVGIFNSCSVTADAEADLRQGVRRAARRSPGIRTIITGCAAGRVVESGEVASLSELPGVAAVIPPDDIEAIAKELQLPSNRTRRAQRQAGARALLRIQDGCDEHCTFCVTTIARGNNRSRIEYDIVREAQQLAETHPEIVLTGTHIGSYGADTGSTLGELVERLIANVPEVRFRLSSIEATEVDDRLLALFRDSCGRLVPYLHAPLQSGSDRLLKRMGRNWYTANTYRERIVRIVADAPVFGLGADIITGFPGETDDDHRETVALVEALPFTSLHVFPFSERPGTAALKMKETVPAAVARERASELREIADRKLDAYEERRAGYDADVVVVRRGKGITEDFLDVAVDGLMERGTRFPAKLLVDGQQLHARRY
jgi:threonylcarbamoyladenosine tRNA methylthiotransferase MtaB